MFREFETPDHVVAHCIAVANVGKKIGEALNKTGFSLDTQIIETAGLLHDMARTDDKHWEVSADFLKQLGFDQEADIQLQQLSTGVQGRCPKVTVRIADTRTCGGVP